MAQLVQNMGKSGELAQAYRKFCSDGMHNAAMKCHLQPLTDPSKILTVCHGDCWTNNMLFNDDLSQVDKYTL